MMQNEFLDRYHDYQTFSGEEAEAEASRANEEGIEGDEAVPVRLGRLGWCLMLKTVVDFIREEDLALGGEC